MSDDRPFHDCDIKPADWLAEDAKAALVAQRLADTVPMLGPKVAEARAALAKERIGEILPDAIGHLRRRASGEDGPILLPNWPNLAAMLGGGFWPGLHILTGGTGTGKSQFALQVALQAALAGIPVRYVGLELDSLGLVARLLCMTAGESAGTWWSSLYTGKWGKTPGVQHLERLVADGGPMLAKLPLYLCTEQGPHGWGYDQIGGAAEQLRTAHPELPPTAPVLFVLDFLQLLGGATPENGAPVRNEDTRERLSKAAYQAREVARKHNVVVLALSSTARTNYAALNGIVLDEMGWPKTHAADLIGVGKESGDIEFASDSSLVLARATGEAKDDGNTYGADPGAMWIGAAKLRAGQSTWCRLVESQGWLSEGAPRGPANTEAAAYVAPQRRKTAGDPAPVRRAKDALQKAEARVAALVDERTACEAQGNTTELAKIDRELDQLHKQIRVRHLPNLQAATKSTGHGHLVPISGRERALADDDDL